MKPIHPELNHFSLKPVPPLLVVLPLLIFSKKKQKKWVSFSALVAHFLICIPESGNCCLVIPVTETRNYAERMTDRLPNLIQATQHTHTYLPLKNKTYCDPIVISVSVTFLLLLTISRVHLPIPVGYLTWYLSLHLNLQYRHRRRCRRYIIIIIRCVLIWKRLLLYQVCCACFHFLHRVSLRLVSSRCDHHITNNHRCDIHR